MKYLFGLILSLSLLVACSPKEGPAPEVTKTPIEVNIVPLCRPAEQVAASLFVGPIEFLPQHLTVSVLERRARMDHLFIQFNENASKDLQDVTALYVGKLIPLMIGETRLSFPLLPHMITNGELVIDGQLYGGDIRALGEQLAGPCETAE